MKKRMLTGTVIAMLSLQWMNVSAEPMRHPKPYTPQIDLTKNPGCGVTGLSREQKIDRNRRLAEFYFRSYLEGPKTRKLPDWNMFDCYADDATMNNFALHYPYDRNMSMKAMMVPGRNLALEEMQLYWDDAVKDWGTEANTFVAYPWENGVHFRHLWSGHAKDGKLIQLLELVTILVDDNGKITHVEFDDDRIGSQELVQATKGVNLKDLSPESYTDMIDNATKTRTGKDTKGQ